MFIHDDIRRTTKDKWVGGVFGGLGKFFDIEPIILRILFIMLTIVFSFIVPIIIYIFLWVLIPPYKDEIDGIIEDISKMKKEKNNNG